MEDDKISNNPKYKKLQEDIKKLKETLKTFKPISSILGMDSTNFDKSLEKILKIENELNETTMLIDKFNDTFSAIGWISTESMELGIIKNALTLAEEENIEKADEFLVNYYSPEWVEKNINRLKYTRGFQPRFEMVKNALEDYKAERHYAVILVLLSIIDGWVSELNIVNFQRQGFFSEKSEILAWDSIAAHPKGLMKLKETFSRPRLMTRTERITIPYRHGIMHGMDLGYDNKFVAAKCWAALFAVREWVIKALNKEIVPPVLKTEPERTLWESIENYKRIQLEKKLLTQWMPREISVGFDIPKSGEASSFTIGTPEYSLVEFLCYWKKKNYGYMAKCFAPMLKITPNEVREGFERKDLIDFELMKVTDITSWITDIQVSIRQKENNEDVVFAHEFRLALNTKTGEMAYLPNQNTVWGVTSWTIL